MRPDKIISGGQSGADQGALVGARQLGIATGGWMPLGFLTEYGPCPALSVYGLREHASPKYPPRTKANVRDADGTIWVGRPGTRGFICTFREVARLDKPFLNNPDPVTLRQWVTHYGIKVLNVAGNRESSEPGTHLKAALLIRTAFGEDR